MAKVVVFIDHDIMIRHFVLNETLSRLADKHDTMFVFPENHKRVKANLSVLPIKKFRTIHVSDRRAHLYRRLYQAALLKNFRTFADRRVLTRIWWHILGWKAFIISWAWSWGITHAIYRFWMFKKIGKNDALNQLLAEEAPQVIVHPTVLEGLFVSDLVRWGRQHDTPTVFIVNSWDNPFTRVMLAGHPDRLVVWGEQSRKAAIQRLGTPPDSIVCWGSAQFALYRRPPKIMPAEYRLALGIPESAKVLLYAGSSKGLNETQHLLMLERAVEAGTLKNCFVVYRPHPWRIYPENEVDFFSLSWKHVVLDPSMEACYRLSRLGQRMHVELADYEDTHVTLSAVDAVISPLSTILLEAVLHGKPVLAYLPDEDMAGNKFMYAVAHMSFFKDFFERVDCIKCESPSRFIEDCQEVLRMSDRPGIANRLKDQSFYFVEQSDRPYADRIVEMIDVLLESRKSRNVPGGREGLATTR